MDILRKIFKSDDNGEKDNNSTGKNEFRKPQWFEESETDDELFDDDRKFAFQIFTNPLEMQKHLERQMQHILEAISDLEENENSPQLEKDLKDEFLKPGFENNFFKEFEKQHNNYKQKKNFADTDLDGEIYADQLHSLMQRLQADDELPSVIPRNDGKTYPKLRPKRKLTDEEKIMAKIHGTLVDEDTVVPRRLPRPRTDIVTPMNPMMPRSATPFGGVFEGTYKGPKMFSQSIMTKTVRKPDGSYETTKVTTDSQGNRTTTVTRNINGKSETVTTYDGPNHNKTETPFGTGEGAIKMETFDGAIVPKRQEKKYPSILNAERNIYVTKEGYAVPRNLW